MTIAPASSTPAAPVSAGPVSAAEQERLDTCSREEIRTPGSVQPHGVLLTADPDTMVVMQASESSHDLLGLRAERLVGTPLADLIGERALEQVRGALGTGHGSANPVPVLIGGSGYDAVVHEVDGVAVVELEPALPLHEFGAAPAVYSAVGRLAGATSREDLWRNAARELQGLTGFDRVMVYHFHPDGHGEVVAEERADDTMEPYLGLHYPASDIPAQARALYLTKLSRAICSTAAEPVAIVPPDNPVTGAPLDLSRAELRSVSPHHLQFMRNMGQAATLSMSLIFDGELIGMITCAHRSPRRLPFALRQGLEIFANLVVLQLRAMSEIGRLMLATELQGLRAQLVARFTAADAPATALLRGPVTLLELVPADGAAVRYEGLLATAGVTPADAVVDAVVERLHARGGRVPFASASLAAEHPELSELMPAVAGLLIVPFGSGTDYLAWFRPEIPATVAWLGDQSESNRATTLSPRTSFSAWSQSVSGRAEPWRGLDGQAADFGRDLDAALARRAEVALAHLGLHDALTGLPNRRRLIDLLDLALGRAAHGADPGHHVSLLFIDVDSFKSVNDTLGHEAGDAVLQQVADRLLSTAGAGAAGAVARLGGDEFVLLCEDRDRDRSFELAGRVLDALRKPLLVDGRPWPVTASIGVAVAEPGDTAASLLRRADASMYRAKRSGKDRAED